MKELIRRFLFVVPLAWSCAAAGAQTVAAGTPLRPGPPPGGAFAASSADQVQAAPVRRDPLWNGAVLGAGLGAILGTFGGLTIIDCTECAGFNVPLTFGVLGAGAGAGIGVAIDALHSKGAASPQRQPHVRVSPLVGKEKRGLMAWIRF